MLASIKKSFYIQTVVLFYILMELTMVELRDYVQGKFGFLKYLIPILLVLTFFYALYVRITIKRVADTRNDVVTLLKNIKSKYNRTTYTNFDSDFIVFSEYLPLDLKTGKGSKGNEIINRFGGKIIFKESPKTLEERKIYIHWRNDSERYASLYNGLGAFTMLFTDLKKQECIHMAMVDWRRVSQGFMGFEASPYDERLPYQGIENLEYYILEDNQDEKYESRDIGTISRGPVSFASGFSACSFIGSSCSFALKFK